MTDTDPCTRCNGSGTEPHESTAALRSDVDALHRYVMRVSEFLQDYERRIAALEDRLSSPVAVPEPTP